MIDTLTRGRLEDGRWALVGELRGLIRDLEAFDLNSPNAEHQLYARLKLGDHTVTFVVDGRERDPQPGPRFLIVDGAAVWREDLSWRKPVRGWP